MSSSIGDGDGGGGEGTTTAVDGGGRADAATRGRDEENAMCSFSELAERPSVNCTQLVG